MTLGAINHVALTVSNLHEAESLLTPVLRFLGYEKAEQLEGLSVWVSGATGTALNLWQASDELQAHEHKRYAPGLHHLAFNAASRGQVDDLYALLRERGVKVLDAPAEYDYAPGYYAVFFEGPDGMKFELAHIPGLQVE
ncbi:MULTISPECIES: VOC family protein [Pseudomonadota]|uniref:VOC family protein n=1 Tax=Pseudomonadota TaxID=1224 RepID=UPI002941CF75|nr:VOC family protein [Marinobacter salarius]WOI18335.1 VOC family protein [Marinobacter salarius]